MSVQEEGKDGRAQGEPARVCGSGVRPLRRPRVLRAGHGGAQSMRRGACASGESGFTLIEVVISMVIMMIVCLGAASLFSFAAYFNSGGNDRAQALAIAQQTLEALRNCKFSTTTTDPYLMATSTGLNPWSTPKSVYRGADPSNPASLGREYTVQVLVTDVPSASGISTLKNIQINVTPKGAGLKWATNGGMVTIETQRAMTGEN